MPNAFGQGCKSVPLCKILKFKYWLRPPKSRIKTTPYLDNTTIGQPGNWMTLHFGGSCNATVGGRINAAIPMHLEHYILLAVKLQSIIVKPFRAITRNPRVRTNRFQLLMLKHDRTYFGCEFKRKYVCDSKM